jgi:hypothetical protein
LTKAIDRLEEVLKEPLLYNVKMQFEPWVTNQILHLFSYFYYMRALVALDHNARIRDSVFETITMDAVGDYLPRAEYVVNDAIIHYHFRQLLENQPQLRSQTGPFEKVLKHYGHNGYFLMQSLPAEFLKTLKGEQMEEALYLVQLDWLLGSDAGLLFKVREELFALEEGYEKIFWSDIDDQPSQREARLEVSCLITPEYLKTLAREAA